MRLCVYNSSNIANGCGSCVFSVGQQIVNMIHHDNYTCVLNIWQHMVHR